MTLLEGLAAVCTAYIAIGAGKAAMLFVQLPEFFAVIDRDFAYLPQEEREDLVSCLRDGVYITPFIWPVVFLADVVGAESGSVFAFFRFYTKAEMLDTIQCVLATPNDRTGS